MIQRQIQSAWPWILYENLRCSACKLKLSVRIENKIPYDCKFYKILLNPCSAEYLRLFFATQLNI